MAFIDTSRITGYQNKQRSIKKQAELRAVQAEKIRRNKENTSCFSD